MVSCLNPQAYLFCEVFQISYTNEICVVTQKWKLNEYFSILRHTCLVCWINFLNWNM